MNRDKEIEILASTLAMVREKRRPIDGDEHLVPVSDYTDATRFERELDRVFRRDFNVVTLSSQMAEPGEFVTADVVSTPVIVVRGEDSKVRAFLNVCRHRGATVETRSEGRCKRFVCPYHAWTYNTDGSLHRVRHPEGFPTLNVQQHGLVELACQEVAGLVFVCPTPGVTPNAMPPEFVEELEAALGPRPSVFASTSRVWNANWKIIAEGGIESYHFSIAHKDTIAPYFFDTLSTWECIGRHMRTVLPKKSLAALEDLPREQWHIRDHAHVLYSLHPNAIILLQKTHFDLIVMTPLRADQTRLDVHTVGSAPQSGELSPKAQAFMAKNHAFSITTLDEDFTIGEQIQRGIATSANSHFRFARFEGALTYWRQRLEAQLA